MRTTERLEEVVAGACTSAGAELFDVELRPGTLLVTVERVGGLDLDALAEVSRAVSDALDADESAAPDGRYELEVSSPGVERRLRRPDHFAGAVGEQVALRTVPGTAGERRVEGALTAADASGIVVLAGGVERRLAYEEVERAHTVFDWRAALAAERAEDGRAGGGAPTTKERAERP